jgi:hypothetical protein
MHECHELCTYYTQRFGRRSRPFFVQSPNTEWNNTPIRIEWAVPLSASLFMADGRHWQSMVRKSRFREHEHWQRDNQVENRWKSDLGIDPFSLTVLWPRAKGISRTGSWALSDMLSIRKWSRIESILWRMPLESIPHWIAACQIVFPSRQIAANPMLNINLFPFFGNFPLR